MFGKKLLNRLKNSKYVYKSPSGNGFYDELTGLIYSPRGKLDKSSLPTFTDEERQKRLDSVRDYVNRQSAYGFLPDEAIPQLFSGDGAVDSITKDALSLSYEPIIDENFSHLWAFDFEDSRDPCIVLASSVEQALNIYVEKYGRDIENPKLPKLGSIDLAINNYNSIVKKANGNNYLTVDEANPGVLYRYIKLSE